MEESNMNIVVVVDVDKNDSDRLHILLPKPWLNSNVMHVMMHHVKRLC